MGRVDLGNAIDFDTRESTVTAMGGMSRFVSKTVGIARIFEKTCLIFSRWIAARFFWRCGVPRCVIADRDLGEARAGGSWRRHHGNEHSELRWFDVEESCSLDTLALDECRVSFRSRVKVYSWHKA